MTVKRITSLFGIITFAVILVFAIMACRWPWPDCGSDSLSYLKIINIAAIQGVIVPANGLTPVTVITENEQYSGTVEWDGNPSTFAPLTSYTATITLHMKEGFTFKGVAADFFTVVGATSVNNAANSNVITAVFPATDSKLVNSIAIITQPDKLTYAHGDALDLTGLVVTLTYDNGSKLEVIAENFPIKSITTNPAQGDELDYSAHNGRPVTITYGSLTCNTDNLSLTMLTLTSIDALETYLQSRPANTADSPYIVALNVDNIMGIKYALFTEGESNKYVNIDLSGSTFTSIGGEAFSGCTNLTSITIPDSIKSIGGEAFYGCTSLTAINVDSNNTNYSSDQGVLYNKNKTDLILYPIRKTENSFIIPNSVKEIGSRTFIGCTNLISITIPDSVTSIGSEAFYGCTSLTSITIPDSIRSIGERVFFICESLTSITIPDGVTSIEGEAFYGCTSLTSITIPDSIRSIGERAFYSCESLTSITIPDGVTSIGSSAFRDCTSLTSITIPDSVTSIGNYAFYDCTRLTSVTIPNGVTRIGEQAFLFCESLTSVTFKGTINYGNFDDYTFGSLNYSGYIGDLRDKYLADGIGTYTRASGGYYWTKQ